jgi:hypothetical protein
MKIRHLTLLAPFQSAAANRMTGTPEPWSAKSLLSRIAGTALVAAAVLGTTALLRAQSPADPSGHWQGTIHIPNQEVAIEVDLARNSTGDARGTFSGVNIKGYPLSDIAIDGAALTFKLKVDGGGAFSGKLSADGKVLAGEFTANKGGYVLPFELSRSGDAKFDPPGKNPSIGKELEGSWTGTLEANGAPMRILLKMANQADGTSTGSVANLDEGAVDIPISAIAQTAATVNFDVKVVNGSFSGTVNAAGTELTGTWSQGAFTAPLTFRRDK